LQSSKIWIEKLKLEPHPEGGYYRETYCSDEVIPKKILPERYDGERIFSTAIYYLLEGNQVSLFHKLKSDETWHFYAGSALALHLLKPDNSYEKIIIGTDILNGEIPQFVVPFGCWFGAYLLDTNSFALIGATVAPGFDFNDFKLGKRSELLKEYPECEDIIINLTKPD